MPSVYVFMTNGAFGPLSWSKHTSKETHVNFFIFLFFPFFMGKRMARSISDVGKTSEGTTLSPATQTLRL
jgi:hypothetical protein